jgi:hypothetical protein
MFSTPRPLPSRWGPSIGGIAIILLALPIFLLADFGLDAWGLGAGLWVAGEVLTLVLTRLPLGLSNLGSSGAVGVGLIFKQLGAVLVLFTVAARDEQLALAAAGLYAVAYTLTLALSMLSYFSQEPA